MPVSAQAKAYAARRQYVNPSATVTPRPLRRPTHAPKPEIAAGTPAEMIAAALRQLQQAEEPQPAVIKIARTIQSRIREGHVTSDDFREAHRALVAADLESGGLHVVLNRVEDALRNGRKLMPAAR